MALRNLVLDMGNVLLTWDPWAFARRAADNEQDAEILADALFLSPAWHLHDAGQIDEEELLHRALLRTPDRLHHRLRLLLASWPQWMRPVPGASRMVTAARQAGLRLYLLSNAGTRFPEALRSRDFYPHFSGMMVSAHEKLAKPDERIYRRLCERFALEPQACFFVDDVAANVAGAMQVGMAGHHFDGDWQPVIQQLRDLGVYLGPQEDKL